MHKKLFKTIHFTYLKLKKKVDIMLNVELLTLHSCIEKRI